jgi:hypothetical protein
MEERQHKHRESRNDGHAFSQPDPKCEYFRPIIIINLVNDLDSRASGRSVYIVYERDKKLVIIRSFI